MAGWRVVVCDLTGTPIENVTPIAVRLSASYRLNRPAAFTFTVPSDHVLVTRTHTDGYPILNEGNRVVKALRKGRTESTYTIRFAGHVYALEDEADVNGVALTQVTAFDPLQLLAQRLCRAVAGSSASTLLVPFTETDGSTIAKTLIDNCHGTASQETGIDTGGTLEATADRTVTWQKKLVAHAILELTEAFDGFDVSLVPVDQTNSKLVLASFLERLGSTKAEAIFSWDVARSNCSSMRRLKSTEQLANAILGVGASPEGSTELTWYEIGSTNTTYRLREDVSTYADVTSMGYLTGLLEEEVIFRENPREIVEFAPIAGITPEPFTDYYIGDTITVNAGARLRGGFSGVQRVYGIDINAGDVETVERVYTSPAGV